MAGIPDPPSSLCYPGGPVDIIRNWVRLQGASAQQESVVLAALDSQYLAKLPKPRKWRKIGTIPSNRAFRSRYYQQVAHILGWKERHVHGFSEAVRDTLKKEVWPDHGEEQGDMATNHSQSIGEKRSSHIDASKERFTMAKRGECKTDGAQVTSEEVHIKDNIELPIHIHERLVGGKEASGRKIEAGSEEGDSSAAGQGVCSSKRTRFEEEGSGSSKSATRANVATRRVLPKWCQ